MTEWNPQFLNLWEKESFIYALEARSKYFPWSIPKMNKTLQSFHWIRISQTSSYRHSVVLNIISLTKESFKTDCHLSLNALSLVFLFKVPQSSKKREWVEREVGGGIGMGNTCKPLAVSFQCMTKSTTNKKKKKEKKINKLSFSINVPLNKPQAQNISSEAMFLSIPLIFQTVWHQNSIWSNNNTGPISYPEARFSWENCITR